jgi:hypothetical protein
VVPVPLFQACDDRFSVKMSHHSFSRESLGGHWPKVSLLFPPSRDASNLVQPSRNPWTIGIPFISALRKCIFRPTSPQRYNKRIEKRCGCEIPSYRHFKEILFAKAIGNASGFARALFLFDSLYEAMLSRRRRHRSYNRSMCAYATARRISIFSSFTEGNRALKS